MKEIIEKFKKHLQVEELSYSTVINYIYHVEEFLKMVDINNITTENIVNYFITLKEKYSRNSLAMSKTALKKFVLFLDLKDIKIPKNGKQTKKLAEFITLEFLEYDLIPMIETVCERALKTKTIIYFMFYSGLRVSEVANLKRDDFDLENKTVKVYSAKTKKERIIPFPKKIKDILEQYFLIEYEETSAFNITTGGIKSMFTMLKPYFENINLHPHTLRHSAATYWRKCRISIENIQYLLGHSNIQSTMIYAHVDCSAIFNDFRKKVK